ncbi:MAG: hypothetical protein OXD46_04995 [Chloroflexi bacterium]|nr:hypothetical protein [Chloroflexota bacterium]
MNITEFTINSRGEEVTCWLVSPDPSKTKENSSLLLNISATRHFAIHDPGQNHPTRPFIDAGHHVLTFDLPHHGDRIAKDSIEATPPGAANGNIRAMSKAFTAGNDPFKQFVSDGMAAIDACLERGVPENGKIVGYGVSRAAYCLLRLAAEDPRVNAVAGPSPVTDWAVIEEFADHADPAQTAALQIENWVDQLINKAVYLCIGSQDDVVSTKSCVQFAMKLFDKQQSVLPEGTLLNRLHVVDTPSHSPGQYWRLDATRFLLDVCHSGNS